MPKVSIIKCQDYEPARIEEAVRRSLELIGGLRTIVKSGQRVLLKVNALMGIEPEAAVTTHPAVVAAVVKEVKKLGAKPLVGDSPGNALANMLQILEHTGIKKAVEAAGGEIIKFQEAGVVEFPSPSNNKRIRIIHLSRAAMEADVIINLPKLKTHNLTLYTGAIKNLFGCVPGFNKSKYHLMAPRPSEFAESLVDILQITKPKLNIMDAVIGMEGNGPSAGDKRTLGAIMASADAVALDAVCSVAIGYKAFDIDTTKIANKRNLGEGRIKKIEIVGTPLSEITQKDWKHPISIQQLTKYLPGFIDRLSRPFSRFIRIDPIIIQELCKKCLICVNNCPAKTIHYQNGKVEIDLKHCIMCFCCHELCPYKAIKLEKSWLVKRLGLGQEESF